MRDLVCNVSTSVCVDREKKISLLASHWESVARRLVRSPDPQRESTQALEPAIRMFVFCCRVAGARTPTRIMMRHGTGSHRGTDVLFRHFPEPTFATPNAMGQALNRLL